MKSITLLYDSKGFQAIEKPGRHFSPEEFRKECDRQGLTRRSDVVLRVILLTRQFLILPLAASGKDFYSLHFSSGVPTASCDLGDGKQKIVYEVPEDVQTFLRAVLPHCCFLSDCALMARYTLTRSLRSSALHERETFCIYLSQGHVQKNGPSPYEGERVSIFLAKQGKMAFANGFQLHSMEELRYFILATREKFARTEHCLLCTTWQTDAALREMLTPHFQTIEEMTLSSSHAEPFLGLFSDIIL